MSDDQQPDPQLHPDETHNLDLDVVEGRQQVAQQAKFLADKDGNDEAKLWASECIRMCLGWKYLRQAFAAVLNQRDEARRSMVRIAFSEKTTISISGTGLGEPGRYQVSTQFEAAAVWWGIPYATKLFGEPAKNWKPPTCQPLPVADQPAPPTKETRP